MVIRQRIIGLRMFKLIFISVLIFYAIHLLFGDIKKPNVMTLTNLDKCPACYGVSVCPELYSSQIALESKWSHRIFNVKNVYHGHTNSNRAIILKKLAHDSELAKFDENLCSEFGLAKGCRPAQLLSDTKIEERILDVVKYNITWPDTEPRTGLVMCPNSSSIFDFLKPVLTKKGNPRSELINVWTMLKINPEPIILQVIQKLHGWPVPAYGGVCGRLEMVANEGNSLSSVMNQVPWYKKLKYALQILDAALDFTYKHERFRFYLMDWSLDNIVVNDNDKITFVDLEDIVVLDKHATPGKEYLEEWFRRYSREDQEPGFTFSIENLCKYHLSDHNIWAACYIILGIEEPFLFPIPKGVNSSGLLEKLLTACVNNNENRFNIVNTLRDTMSNVLSEVKVKSDDF